MRRTRLLSVDLASRSHHFLGLTIRAYSSRPGPLQQYKDLVRQGKLQRDPYQENVAMELENLLGRMGLYEKDMEEYHVKLADWENERENERRKLLMEEAGMKQHGSLWDNVNKQRNKLVDRWMSRKWAENIEPGVGKWVSYLNRERKLDSVVGRRPTPPCAPRGVYLYGNVGSGKTMLMDMFYSSTKGIVKHRRRYHFHEAMLEINAQMHQIWKRQLEDNSAQSKISSWITNLPFDSNIKEWLVGEEMYKQEVQMKNILSAVADNFLIDHREDTGASILCFDEIQTIDVFAIVALSGILSRLLSTGTVLVATSNRAPQDLNQDGMQRDIFLKLVDKMTEHCENILIGSEIDYRRLIVQASANALRRQRRWVSKVNEEETGMNLDLNMRVNILEQDPKRFTSIGNAHFLWPLDGNGDAQKEFQRMWQEITDEYGGKVTSKTLPVMFGRSLEVPQSCNGIARFTFECLCGRPVGAADYIAIARNYHTVFISDIPKMSMRIRDKARRFITLVDEIYNHHCCLICSAACSIDDLFQGTEEGSLFDLESFQFETETEGTKLRRDVLAEGNVSAGGSPSGIISILSGQEEMFAFRRAVSRLIEMQAPLYLEGVCRLHPYFQRQKQGG